MSKPKLQQSEHAKLITDFIRYINFKFKVNTNVPLKLALIAPDHYLPTLTKILRDYLYKISLIPEMQDRLFNPKEVEFQYIGKLLSNYWNTMEARDKRINESHAINKKEYLFVKECTRQQAKEAGMLDRWNNVHRFDEPVGIASGSIH